MVTRKLHIHLRCKYPKLLYWLNVPLYIIGLDPFAPDWAFEKSGICIKKNCGDYTGP